MPQKPEKHISESWRERRKKDQQRRMQQQYDRMQNNPELMQTRQEMKDEFLATHPHFSGMSEKELQKEMAAHAQEEDKIRRQKLRSHLETFSDGVIAVIITIMLLEIPTPTGRSDYWVFLSSVGIFLVSFIIVANFWFNHHKTFAITEEITENIIVQDFIFIGLLSLIPLLTKWIMLEPSAFSTVNYGITILLILIQQEMLNRSITKDYLKSAPKSFKFWQRIWLTRFFFTMLVNISITIIATFFPMYGHWLFIIVPIFNFFFRMFSDKNHQFQYLDNGWLETLFK